MVLLKVCWLLVFHPDLTVLINVQHFTVLINHEYVDNSMMEPLNLSPHGRFESKADDLKL